VRLLPALAAVLLLLPVPGAAAEGEAAAKATWIDAMARAAAAWVGSVGDRAGARLPFESENRRDWHYVPRSRRGVALRNMTAAQRDAARALVRSGLSPRGFERAEATMALQSALAEMERSRRDPLDYHVTVFGAPGTPPWGWRLEGHHLSVNVSVPAAGRASVTPLFTGARPARHPSGPRRGERLHEAEHRLALELVRGLDAAQTAKALLSERALPDVVAGPGRRDALARPQGLPASEMTAAQRALLLRLVETFVGLARDEWGRPYMDLVRAGLDDTRFAWAGPRREGAAFYWRVHGPRVWIEFDHTQGDPDHVHALWRDPAADFGRDHLREHYEAGDHAPPPSGR
jgi:hypothetical protein